MDIKKILDDIGHTTNMPISYWISCKEILTRFEDLEADNKLAEKALELMAMDMSCDNCPVKSCNYEIDGAACAEKISQLYRNRAKKATDEVTK